MSFFQAEDGIRDRSPSRGLGDVYKRQPTISPLSEDGWFGVNTVIKKEEFHKLIPKLRKIAQGLVVHEPRQILELEEIKRDEEN